jgi:hypothetical protein
MQSDQACGDDPWMAAMRRGDFDAAWTIADAVMRERRRRGVDCHGWPRHLQFIWTGQPFTGRRVLVRCYHGLGDTLQFIRFAAPLRAMAREVVVWSQPELVNLVGTAPGVDVVLPLNDGAPQVDYDVDVEIMELAHALRITPASVAPTIPYLFPERAPPRPRRREFSIGIVWAAGDWDLRRSVPGPLLRRLADIPDVHLFSLQRPIDPRQIDALGATDISSADLHATATRIQQLDLIVTVDTMMAHLAGALGRRTWVLLHRDCDWRWGTEASSVWYPTVRLFCQHRQHDWGSVIDEVAIALRHHLHMTKQSRNAGGRVPKEQTLC